MILLKIGYLKSYKNLQMVSNKCIFFIKFQSVGALQAFFVSCNIRLYVIPTASSTAVG